MWSGTGMAATAMKEGASGVTKDEWRSTAAPSGQTQHVGKCHVVALEWNGLSVERRAN